MNFWNDFEMISNNFLTVDIALIIVQYFQGLVLPQVLRSVSCWTDVCLRKNYQISQLMENLGQESDGKGDCVSFLLRSTYNIIGWEIHSLFSAAGWPPAISHAHVCDIPTHSQSTRLIFLLMAKILASCQTRMTAVFMWNLPKKWNKVILQVIALLIQIKFREAQGNLVIAHSEMYKT